MKHFIVYLILVIIMTGLAQTTTELEQNKAVVLEFYDRFFNKGDVNAADELVAEKYIQHNPNVPDGRDAIKPFVAQGPFPADVKRIVAEGDLVVAHVYYPLWNSAAVDIFRLQDGMIVEHWDVVQKVPEQSANSNSMF
jgi:predicted SnoaL-like aldol condensation-catalyzing enzyme